MDKISIRGARTHNLRNLSLTIPRNKLVVITGRSGSGKSSLAFDTLYAEGQRRYVESLSSYARQFLSLMDKPDVDSIEGLSPAISIEQKAASHNPRSTVGTVTEIHDYLRLMWARIGLAKCPEHGTVLKAQTVSQMVDAVLQKPEGSKIMILSPIVRGRKGEYKQLFSDLVKDGFIRARIDGEICDLSDPPDLALREKHNIDLIVDRIKVRQDLKQRLADSFETALKYSEGLAVACPMDEHKKEDEILFSSHYSCPICGYSIPELEPRDFSFNNPHGSCPKCEGLGVMMILDEDKIVPDKNKSVFEGAISGWDRQNPFFFRQLEAVASYFDIDLRKPYKALTDKERKYLLYGTGKTAIPMEIVYSGGKKSRSSVEPFEGVIPNFERRLHETESEYVRYYISKLMRPLPCPECHGTRLKKEYCNVFVNGKSLPEINDFSIKESYDFFDNLKLSEQETSIAARILKEIKNRLGFLINVGLGYLTLSRSAETLSGGESQRIRLASQIGAGLTGVMYVLDEPSIGLHQRDNSKLLMTLKNLRNIGNTVIVVEHDEDTMRAADHIIDIGPGAGINGGKVVAEGTVEDIENTKDSLTGDYLAGRKKIEIPKKREKAQKSKMLTLKGCRGNNLKNVTASFPVGCFVVVTGVSGSGKSTLVNDTLVRVAERELNGVTANDDPAPYDSVSGLEHFDKIICIDQSPIGRTPRSNPATYVGLFSDIRDLFAKTPEARARGYTSGRFSFNVKGGRCEACQGDGTIRVSMNFLPDVYVKCEQCDGKRYNRETLEVLYKGKTISDVLDMNVEQALEFFEAVPSIANKLKTLMQVGLSYITLGQAATTFSGGEAQRIKLSKELSKRATGKTLYVLDEPTTGLHFEDVKLLLEVLLKLRDQGNTVVVIEHNLDVIKTADYLIDLGPEGGSGGGEIIACGTPEEISKCEKSFTGHFLKPILERGY
ncbi:MAG: excinuclease ABC subunit UvrA [Succinatimonas sp.]|jgi:excinuclease ABC, A subunit|uniref:excinuclease ABC subunit UvrA n=1 Tax=Succinivibrio sp. TaxID=2053619 RepID=UPI001B48B726|nr:excinuclease ABC subunit UvrA [Succinivibrio sp.]MCI6345600.1 excinuclease ABC subunit UvrA [Succinatimonas sp.]MDD6755885.1 excinuclease ABC subunit UvrA [Succinatimonas sp.]MDY6245991.1 excinuclease ABC subunit UvrA [Succinivibrio sp.]MDY6260566.1 excinuclease ABC subunit UvrA [Succinivibrio sp.]